MSGTDFNDLYQLQGPEAVRRQLVAALGQGPANDESPAPSNVEGRDQAAELARPDLEEALRRYALTYPDGKVWDSDEQVLLKKSVLKEVLGAQAFKDWVESDERRTLKDEDVRRAKAAAQQAGGGELAMALARFVYIYPSQSVWDKHRREIVPLNDLKVLLHRWYTPWLESPAREVVDKEKIVFDPTLQADPEDHINMFRGLPLKPMAGTEQECWSRCNYIIQLLHHLTAPEEKAFEWLVCWLAYPLQHVGAKMASAVLMHSEVHGSGKSLFFERVVKPLYGEYASTLGQHQLESQYTDWKSGQLFGLFEEVFSRDQKYSHTGVVKHMVTGDTHRIEKKFVSGWEEANHMNAAFLSNEIQPFPVEPSDRRFLVVWPRDKLPVALRDAVLDQVNNGGIEAFYGWLLHQALEWVPPGSEELERFTTHTEPPVTRAKARLIEFGRPSWDTFYQSWRGGELPVPYMTCLTSDLFAVYRHWCRARNEHVVSQTKFSSMLATRERKRSGMVYGQLGESRRKGTFFLIAADENPERKDNDSQEEWLARCVAKFQGLMVQNQAEDG